MPRQDTRQPGSNNISNRGFASMDEETQREIASKGGKAAQANGNAHRFDSAEAREAGKKGGRSSRQGNPSANNVETDDPGRSYVDGASNVEGDVSAGPGINPNPNPPMWVSEGGRQQVAQDGASSRGDRSQSERDDTDRQGRPQNGSQGSSSRGAGSSQDQSRHLRQGGRDNQGDSH